MRVLLTGARGTLAQALIPALRANAGIAGVTAVDDVAAEALLANHDALVYLPRPGAGVRTAHKLFHAAREEGLKRLIHVSTAAVYGEAIHASEDTPLKPSPGFEYAREQAELERLLAIDLPQCVRLRPHVVVGRHAHPLVRAFLRQPFYPRPAEAPALFQCVHEDDLAAALVLALEKDAQGAYNLATEESFTLREALGAHNFLVIGLRDSTARRGLRIASRLLRREIDPAWLDRAGATLLVNCRRAFVELGWRPRYSALEAIAAT